MARRESALLWGYSGWRMRYSVVCVKMCGKCWLTHHCCRHMETQQIRLEGCPGSLLSPHRLSPTRRRNLSRVIGALHRAAPWVPSLLTVRSRARARIVDNWVSPLWFLQSSGSLMSLLCQVYLWKGARPNLQTGPIKLFPPFQAQTQKV